LPANNTGYGRERWARRAPAGAASSGKQALTDTPQEHAKTVPGAVTELQIIRNKADKFDRRLCVPLMMDRAYCQNMIWYFK
jgi:hypothetical protein